MGKLLRRLLCRLRRLVVVAEEEDDAIYTIFFNKKRARRGAHYVCYGRLIVEVFLELNEGKREHLCLSMSPMQTASSVLQHFHLDKASSEVIINGWEAHFSVLDMELDCFGKKDEDGVLQMMIKPCVGNLSPGLWTGMCVII